MSAPAALRGRLGRALASLLLLGMLPAPVFAQTVDGPSASVQCQVCHGNFTFLEGKTPTPAQDSALLVTAAVVGESVHGFVGCVACHPGQAEGYPHEVPEVAVSCQGCHERVGSEYAESVHGYAVARGNPRAPTCASCHGAHDVLPSSDPRSRTYKGRLVAVCADCHGTPGLLTDRMVRLPQTVASYSRSVHGKANGRGVRDAAVCTDCHGVHDLRGYQDPESKINRMKVASTCGNCHGEIAAEYEESIHGRALEAGLSDSPTCIDCHGEHLILSPGDPEADTYAANLAVEVCAECHNDPAIIAKYGLQPEVVGSYEDSYHGWAVRAPGGRAATCVSCHSAHMVLPKGDPASTVHPANVAATCQGCHPNADLAFAESYDHYAASITNNPINRVIRTVYIVLIAVVIGGMVLHNLLIMNYYLVTSRNENLRAPGVVRFDRVQVIQHLVLALSFIVLVLTGFALRYQDAAWVRFLAALGLTEPARSTIHRFAGVLLILFSFWHVVWLLSSSRGKSAMRALLPRRKDLRDLVDNLRYHAFLSPRRARIGRYGYPAKVEYWSLVWGTALMALTGLVLWFPTIAVKLFPSWTIAASQTVHFYEAWLATLAILVWHFFFVIFHPDVYPMSWIWLTGRMPVEEIREHHTGWFEEEIGPTLGAAVREEPGQEEFGQEVEEREEPER